MCDMALKLSQYFYLLMEKPLGRYFQVRSPYYQAAKCNQKTSIPVSSRWQVRSNKAKKGEASTLITIEHLSQFQLWLTLYAFCVTKEVKVFNFIDTFVYFKAFLATFKQCNWSLSRVDFSHYKIITSCTSKKISSVSKKMPV